MNVNTVSMYPTHFLRGVELVERARGRFNIPSENWPAPTKHRFGVPNDHYYAEVWSDGMDWQTSYWMLEEKNLEKPQIQPLIIFDQHEDELAFNHYDFSTLINAAMYYRREFLWINKGDLGFYTDAIWPFLRLVDHEVKFEETKRYEFEHASQKPIQFWMNTDFIPEQYRENMQKRSHSGIVIGGIPNQ